MKHLAADVWNDLREKRLWPLAALLLIALVAVPVVLAKSSETPPPPAAPQVDSAPNDERETALARVQLEEAEVGDGSSLDTFDPSDPFTPPEQVVEDTELDELGELIGADGGGDVAAPVVDDTVSVDVEEPGSGGGGSGGTDTDQGQQNQQGGGEQKETKTTEYAYVLDVTFAKNAKQRRVKGLEKLDMLPSKAAPLLIYMGVTQNAGNAVFMVDATLQTTGEGSCKPSGDDCAFLHLGAGSEQMFTDDEGNTYRLEIDQIRRVKVGSDGSASSSKKGRKRPRASAAVGAPRRFVLPLLADLVSVSTTTDSVSGTGGRGR